MALVDTVRRTLQREQLASSSTRVLVALSGGPDSMTLLHLLHALHEHRELTLVGAAHLNHQLRDQADRDQQFCATAAAALQLPFLSDRVDVRTAARAAHRSIEDAAHHVRYDFFARTAAALGADAVALGHTRDDQAETFLLRLLRGAGTRGLGGMHPRSGIVIRPLIEVGRQEVLQFLAGRQLPFLHDETNDDLSIPRNRVRAELLPLLAERFNPRIAEVLAGEAELARADDRLLDQLADEWCARHLVVSGPHEWRLDRSALLSAPKAIAWRALRKTMSRTPGHVIGVQHIRRAWDVATGEGAPFDAPRQRVQREDGWVVLTGRPADSVGRPPAVKDRRPQPFECHLPVPGEVTLPGGGATISAEVGFLSIDLDQSDRFFAVVPKEKVADGLIVRTRRPGDRLKPSDAGHRKLQDLLVDRKVPASERDRIPIVADALGRIVWVAGHVVDRDFRVSDPAQAVVILRLKGVGGSF